MNRLFLLPLLCLTCIGCFSFGPKVTTSKPTPEQVLQCRSEMYIRPDIQITPEGYRGDFSGMDGSIYFRFRVKTTDISQVFAQQVDTTLLKPGFEIQEPVPLPKWWDAANHKLIGEEIELPNVKYLHLGYVDNGDGSLTVYALWHEV